MDVWVFAAAAGAGYVAQQLKSLNKAKRNSCHLSSQNSDLFRTGCTGATLKPRESFGQEHYIQRKHACNDGAAAEDASTSGAEDGHHIWSNDVVNSDMSYDSNSLAGLQNNEDIQGEWEDRVPGDADEAITSDSMPQPSLREIGFSYGFIRNKSNPRFKRIKSKIVKPRTSLESCLLAQLFKEHAEFEDCVCGVHPQQKSSLKPFPVTDGIRITSRVPRGSCSGQSEMVMHEVCFETSPNVNKSVVGIPRLPNLVPTELQKRDNVKSRNEQVLMGSDGARLPNGDQNNKQGLSDGAFQCFLGLAAGILYSFLGNKSEIDKLRKSLAQCENLIEDLQEELKMKDELTVKELAVEDHKLLGLQNDSCIDDTGQALYLEAKQDNYSRNCNEEHGDQSSDEESLRKIEAELEAELDMLESNMKSSSFEGQMSNIAKLDPNFVSDVIEGELRADLFGVKVGTQAYAERDKSHRSTPRYAQYPVSPRELSLRLHEVIQSRLEERVQELETALHQSQMNLKCLKSFHTHSSMDFPTDKTGVSSNHGSPIAQNLVHSTDQPVIINLSAETPAAYNDTYEESTKLSESDEEESHHHEIFHQYHLVPLPDSVQHGGFNGCTEREFVKSESQEMVINPVQELSNDGLFSSRDDSEEDEMEKLLIRQIVEKARQGSPALLKAQRALLSTDFS